MISLALSDLLSSLAETLIAGILLWLAIWAIVNVVRRPDLTRARKVVWIAFVVLLPYLAVSVYLAVDVVRRTDLSRNRKAVWVVCLVVFTIIAAPVYFVRNRGVMAERNRTSAAARASPDVTPP